MVTTQPTIIPQVAGSAASPLATTNGAKPNPHGLSLAKLNFRYEPFPIALFSDAFAPRLYDELMRTWPPDHFFASMPKLGQKYSLSERNNPLNYEWFIQNTSPWREVHAWLKSREFVAYVLERLAAHHIHLGYEPQQLTTRFEFSMMGADGGHIKPHTDLISKVITLVVFMVRPQEWDPSYGGGTAVLRTRDPKKSFNLFSSMLGFDDVEQLEAYPYQANHGVLFIKTFNSWHAVYPLRGPANLMRRSLTINIEDPTLVRGPGGTM